MPNDLTTSPVDRQNILNNPYAVAEIEKAVGIRGIPFEGRSVVLKEQVAAFFEVDARTIDNYLARFDAELRHNGYEVVRGKHLKELKIAPHGLIAAQNNEFFKERGCKSVRCRGFGGRSPLMKKAESQAPTGRINPFGFRAKPGLSIQARLGDEAAFVTKTTVLGVFDIRAFLNLAMLMAESERARLLRQPPHPSCLRVSHKSIPHAKARSPRRNSPTLRVTIPASPPFASSREPLFRSAA